MANSTNWNSGGILLKSSADIVYYNSNLRQDVGWNKWKLSSFNAIHEKGYNCSLITLVILLRKFR